MKHLTYYIALLTLSVLSSILFPQQRQREIINVKRLDKQKHNTTFVKDFPKSKRESEIVRTKPTRKTNFSNPPQRSHIKNDPSKNSNHRRHIAGRPVNPILPYHHDKTNRGQSIEGDCFYPPYPVKRKEKKVILIEDKKENYYPVIKYINGKEYTDKDFPLCIKTIEFDYIGKLWLNVEELPETVNGKKSGYYFIYKIIFEAYVFDLSYEYPFAICITYPDHSSDIIIYNYDSQNLQADSVYLFEEEMPLKRSGYAWVTLGFYDFEYEQFYPATFSPYITKQKVYIPYAVN